jgi:hypothetical protein
MQKVTRQSAVFLFYLSWLCSLRVLQHRDSSSEFSWHQSSTLTLQLEGPPHPRQLLFLLLAFPSPYSRCFSVSRLAQRASLFLSFFLLTAVMAISLLVTLFSLHLGWHGGRQAPLGASQPAGTYERVKNCKMHTGHHRPKAQTPLVNSHQDLVSAKPATLLIPTNHSFCSWWRNCKVLVA